MPAEHEPPETEPRSVIARRWPIFAALGVAALVGTAIALLSPLLRRNPADIDPGRLAAFSPLRPSKPPSDSAAQAQIALGRMLWYEPRLSRNKNVSCNTCHPLDAHGADGKPRSRSSENEEHPRNTPSVYNAAGFFVLLWDGRKDNLLAQAKDVLVSPKTMVVSQEQVVDTLRSIPGYRDPFARAFPGAESPVSFHNAAQAIAAFEATLFTRARWDRFLEGDAAALSSEEKAGFNRFIEVGCVACHFGPNIGATMYQKAGLVKPWPDSKDRGRYEVTKQEVDYMVFRVPTLRNVAMTAPYFHDGSESSLDESIRIMARHQIGRELDDEDVSLIAAWLKSLTGEIPADHVALQGALPGGQ
jgi:cytochrome c peroxidase